MPNILKNPPRLPLVFPSILSADFATMGDDVRDVMARGADGVHLDVMDGHFVPNLTMGVAMIKSLRKHFPDVYLDVHLMVTNPEQYIDSYAKAGANCFTFHIEATLGRKQEHEKELIPRIKDAGMQAGIAINPSTPAASIDHVIDDVDLVLVMSVHPGFSGQSFMPEVLEKTRRIKAKISDTTRLEMDGGLGPDTIAATRDAGCDTIVAASAIFGSDDRTQAINILRGE